jgi:hypothetical protein
MLLNRNRTSSEITDGLQPGVGIAPFSLSPELLDDLTPFRGHEDVWKALRLLVLVGSQQIDQILSQWQCTVFGVLGVPFPGFIRILLGIHLHGEVVEIYIPPRCVQDFASPNARGQFNRPQHLPSQAVHTPPPKSRGMYYFNNLPSLVIFYTDKYLIMLFQFRPKYLE